VCVDGSLVAPEDVMARSDILVIGASHCEYATATTTTETVDVWNLLGQGTTV
jgi:hypothetical protein